VHPILTPSSTDAEAIRRARTDPRAFREVYDRHVAAVHRFLRIAAGPDSADDLAAETFARALRGCAAYVPRHETARGWLLGIAANVARGHHRANGRARRAFLRLPRPAAGRDDPTLERLLESGLSLPLAAALEALSPAEREVLLLAALSDLTYQELADALRLPVGTVRSRLHRARTSARRALKGLEP
jgi:RNA polymerase sigma-70 factor (ECF subfamily)